jgi:hypothetical protein
MQGQRIDDAANILDDKIVDEFYPTSLRIDSDVRRRCTIGIGEPLIVRKAGSDRCPNLGSGSGSSDSAPTRA